MLYRLLKGNTENIKIISVYLLKVIMCLITVILLFCISALTITYIDFTYEALPAVIAAILTIASAFDGFMISRLSKENGLFWGVFAGTAVFVFVMIISLICGSFGLKTEFFTKALICIIAGAIGGIIGVNIN